ncbi:MAG: endonuclease/exonuclease/phosphatase family protein [Pseudomonadota bacterium]
MLKVLPRLAAICGVTALMGCASATPLPGPPEDGTLRLATYNVHYIWLDREEGNWSVGDWERRKGPLDEAFKALQADVVAFQEMESFSFSDNTTNLTLDWLLANNPEHRAAAVGDPAVFPSTQPMLYRPDTLSVLDQGWFFFSDTPDVIYSRTFNGSFPAYATWVEFEERASGKSFTVVNVHYEFSSGSNRVKSAELVNARTAERRAAGERVVLTGDLNALSFFKTVRLHEEAGFTFLPVRGATYHLNRGINLFGAIDHIALHGNVSAAGEPVVLRRKFSGEWPTDHYPVFADLVLD